MPSEPKEASERTQWILIAVGAVGFIATAAWSVITQTWWLLAALIAATAYSAHGAWRAGLPLWPGRERGGSETD